MSVIIAFFRNPLKSGNEKTNPSAVEHSVAALLAVQIFFGSLPVIAKVVLAVVPPMSLVGFRIAIAALVLLSIQIYRRRVWLQTRSDYIRLGVLSLFGVVFNQLLFIGGLSRTKASNERSATFQSLRPLPRSS